MRTKAQDVDESPSYRVCVMPELFGEINRKTVDALTAHGYEVVVPQNQGCCGALHIHAGDSAQAQALAKQNVRAFLDADVDWIVLNSAGCGASMSEYGHWFDDGPDKDEASKMSAKVIDIMEALCAREIDASWWLRRARGLRCSLPPSSRPRLSDRTS